MNSYLIESLAPLVFRSGKPFGSQASAQDVTFPLPSAAAGLTRALAIGQGTLEGTKKRLSIEQAKKDENYQKILSTKARGAFLVRYNDKSNDTDNIEVLVPKPANALYFENKNNKDKSGKPIVELVRLAPTEIDDDCGSDMPQGLLHVQMEKVIKGKPQKGAMYWTLTDLQKWQAGTALTFETVNDNGMSQLPIDIRTHVSIDDDTLASEDGKLFQTASFDMAHPKDSEDNTKTWSDKRYGFLVQSDIDLANGLATFGGERRLSNFKKVDSQLIADDITKRSQAINQAKGFTLTFLTPCIFAQGYLPSWIGKDSLTGVLPNTDITVTLKAVAIDRWQGVSGWDSIVWKPKATRKAVSAGSVYWFELAGNISEQQLSELDAMQWADNIQDKADGYGTALLSAWNK